MSKQKKNAKKPAASKAAGKNKTIKSQRQTAANPTKKPGKPSGQKVKTAEKENFPHFRKYKKSNHPALIVGEQKGKKTDNQGKEHETD